MRVGTVVQLKQECLNNNPGALGIIFYTYSGGVQVIFENGEFDGFSSASRFGNGMTEIECYLLKVGFCNELAGYKFKNAIKLANEYRAGKFNNVFHLRAYEIGAAL